MKLTERVAVVTGAGSGIGTSICQRFASEGAYVVAVDVRGEGARMVEQAIMSSGWKAHAMMLDPNDAGMMKAGMEKVAKELGHIDILVNAAELHEPPDIADLSIEHMKKMLDMNLLGSIISARAVFPYMRQQKSGSIINVGSYDAYAAAPRAIDGPDHDTIPIPAYGLSKAGVAYVTKSMARYVGSYKIRVNQLCLGLTLTDESKRIFGPKAFDAYARSSAMNRVLEGQDAAGAALFLASDDSMFMTGQTLVVDAGNVMLG